MEHSDKQEILEAIGLLAEHMQEMRFDITDIKSDVGILKSDVGILKSDVGILKSDVGILKSDVGILKSDVGVLKSDAGSLKSKITRIEATMVTKDYLDDKLADLHSDVVKFVKRRVPCWNELGV